MTASLSGTVTLLFSDIEASTELLYELGDEYSVLISDQRKILRKCFTKWEGHEVDTQGDSFFFSFPRASQALSGAVDAQRELHAHKWPHAVEVRVRMALHTGEPLPADEGYVGMDVHRAARIAQCGHGGQILLSETTAPLVLEQLPDGAHVLDLGRHRLKDLRRPERITQVSIDGLELEFPALKSLEAMPPDLEVETGRVKDLEALLPKVPEGLPVFVGRESEQDWLRSRFEEALNGQGQIAFVKGGAGRGKTALLEVFSLSISTTNPETFIAWGECSGIAGRGDPYLPFQQIVRTLTGDISALWESGRLSQKNAMHLLGKLPFAASTMVTYSPGLVNSLVSGARLNARIKATMSARGPWMERLSHLADQNAAESSEIVPGVLFEQVEYFFSELAAKAPLIVILDDLQWVDSASADLLFHLSRRLSGKRILFVGAYRPEELTTGLDQSRHPLLNIVHELQRYFGDNDLDLSRIPAEENRKFIDQLIDSEPNYLDDLFRDSLYQHTDGHPLFTVELLRNMQERGTLKRVDGDAWAQATGIDWDEVPARVEGVIEERIHRLDPMLREVLEIGCIEGEIFSANVIAEILDLDERELYKALGSELDRKHRLVREQDIQELSDIRLSRFAFRHILYAHYLYQSLGESQRRQLHAAVGSVLERLYGEDADRFAPNLALHFSEAIAPDKAVRYLVVAGDQARLKHAFLEATGYYQQALMLLERGGQTELTARTLLKLGLIYTAEGEHEEANRVNEQAFELWTPLRELWDRERTDRPGRTLRIATAEPQTLDPGIISDDTSVFVASQLFEGLVALDAESNVLPAAAENWEIMDAGKRYRFRLRDGQHWSDGSAVNAEDFAFAWRRALKLSGRSPVAKFLFVIKNARKFASSKTDRSSELGVHVLDPLTLEVELEAPIAYFPHLLTHPVAFPLPSDRTDDPDRDWYGLPVNVSNGAFQLIDVARGDRLELQRNPHYNGVFPGNVERIECVILDDYAASFDSFDHGELDMVSMITSDPKTVRLARRRYRDELHFIPHLSTLFVSFWCETPPFERAEVRRAFVHAIDRSALVSETSQGQYHPALGGFLPPGMAGYQPDIGLKCDPKFARKLLADAGYPGGENFPTVRLLFTGPDPNDPIIRFLCMAWKNELGVEIQAENTTWEEFLKRRDEDPPELSVMGYSADYPDPDAVLRVLFHSEQGFNPSRCFNAELNALVESAAKGLDPTQRIRAYQRADQILVREEASVLPLGYGRGRLLVKPAVQVPNMPLSQIRMKEVVVGSNSIIVGPGEETYIMRRDHNETG